MIEEMKNKYNIIYADPAWQFNNKNTGGSMVSGANAHYDVMNLNTICNLPVPEMAADDCVLFLWWVASQPLEALKVVEAWGFKLKAIGNQLGAGYLSDLKVLIEDCECKERFKIVEEPTGKFQSESDFGCITGIWVTQYSVGMEGDSYEGTIWVKLKNYKYLEMPFSC